MHPYSGQIINFEQNIGNKASYLLRNYGYIHDQKGVVLSPSLKHNFSFLVRLEDGRTIDVSATYFYLSLSY